MTLTIPQDTLASPAPDPGWRARLDLEISRSGGRSVVSFSKQKGPLTIQSPFYPEGETCHLYLLHPPAGIVGGDKLCLTVQTKNQGAALITTPGATKFYRSNGLVANQQQNFTIEDNSSLEWLPQETIYFPNAVAKLDTTIHLEGSGQYMGWDIHCLGLPANKKDFAKGTADIRFSLFRDNRPLLIEALRITAAKKKYQAAFLQDHPITGTFIATGGDEQLLQLLREQLPQSETEPWGATCIDDIIILRYLGDSTNEARELFVAAWSILRPHILDRKPEIPRIWAT